MFILGREKKFLAHFGQQPSDREPQKERMMKRNIAPWMIALALIVGLSACTNPYDPAQRAVGGGLLGAGARATIGAAAGGGQGAALGAAIGGAAGALGGVITTPVPAYGYGYYSPPASYYGYYR
jgi:type IV secretory pathway TrbL component